jgi:Raf kinase inhibitor-like YbhB/YbcL family protein
MRTLLAASLVLALGTTVVVGCSASSTTVPKGRPAADGGPNGSTGEDAEDAGTGEPAGPMTLTSTAFEDGAKLPAIHTCDGEGAKKEVSPPLAWTPGPEGTSSYAIVFTDATNGLVHSAIYDIPATTTSLPEGIEGKYEPSVPAGAKQSLNYKKASGYAGPCPPDGEHEYVFTLYALNVETLAGLTKDSTASAVEKAALEQDLATSKLTTKYTRK